MEIAEETGETVGYAVESDRALTFIESFLGPEGIRTEVDLGFRSPLHTSPEGKLVLACLPSERRRELINRIDFPLENSIGRAAFTAELDEIRANNIPYGTETIVKNVATVSVPVNDNEDVFYGVVVVAGPTLRFTDTHLESVTETLQSKVGKLNVNLSYETKESTVESRLATSRSAE